MMLEWQNWTVYLIVAYAGWIVVRRYAPASLRRTVGAGFSAHLRRFGWHGLADKLMPSATADARAGSCGSCDNCASNDTRGAVAAIKEFAITPDALKQTIRR
jgi:hypothetical protein